MADPKGGRLVDDEVTLIEDRQSAAIARCSRAAVSKGVETCARPDAPSTVLRTGFETRSLGSDRSSGRTEPH
jgi:hypothetical protein